MESKLLKNARSSINNEMNSQLNIIEINLEDVNCYLIKNKDRYILIDSGLSKNREEVENSILEAGCDPGDLDLIIATHGDSDHIGNCKYLRERFKSKIAMHSADIGMAETGDFSYNRDLNFLLKQLGKLLAKLFKVGLKKEDRFTPDIFLENGQSLADYGFNAFVYNMPGHSKGSIGLLLEDGSFFCGDLLENKTEPSKASMIADKESFAKSLEILESLSIKRVYPGHGTSFLITHLNQS